MKKILFPVCGILFTVLLITQCQQKPNNVTAAPDNGTGLFTQYCVRCHQVNGMGGPTPTSGPLAGQGVQAIDIRQQTKSVPELVAIITNGFGQMPSFGDSVSAENIQLIATYVAMNIEKHPGNSVDTTGVFTTGDSTK